VVRLLANPLVLRAGLVLFLAACAFVFAVVLIRHLRRSITEEGNLVSESAPSSAALPLHIYNTVIQQLKQQKHELQVQTQAEQRRARTTENFSQAVLSNLSSGVLVFGVNGLVKQANPAAKDLLGFASPAGMSAEDVFRDTLGSAPDADPAGAAGRPVSLAEEVRQVLRQGGPGRQVQASYATPAGHKRHIAVMISPVPAVDGGLLGAACLITDLSEFERIRHQQELHDEISAEMALELRTSLATIAGYAQQLADSRDPQAARQLASDIAGEAARLDHHIGGFLAEKRLTANTGARVGIASRA
jgi:PAS domain-containing protein